MKISRVCCWLLLNFCALHAEEAIQENGALSSKQANYDGSNLILTGEVVLDHGLGIMNAEEAILQRQETDKEFPFSLIDLRQDVLLSLKNSARICCDEAHLDFTTLKGNLSAGEKGVVTYTDQVRKKRGESVPLELQGKKIDLLFSKSINEADKTDYQIENILAKEKVFLKIAQDIQLQAHQVLYRKESPDNKTSKKEFQGTLSAYPENEQTPCMLSYLGDEIYASMIDIDLFNGTLSLLKPKGLLAAAIASQLEQPKVHFQSDYLYWDQNKNTLTLKGHIAIEEEELGTLYSQEELILTESKVEGKRSFKTIDSKGPTTLLYKDAHKEPHKLLSYGQMHLDREGLVATADSPITNGKVAPKEQLYYETSELAFYADKAQIEYCLVEDKQEPSALTLQGNIRLFVHDPAKPARFGVADKASYSLMTQTLILSARPGKKVLFWDEAQGMRLSAPEVHITYDSETKQQTIKGVGAVQFAFTPEEQSTLQKLFPQWKPNP